MKLVVFDPEFKHREREPRYFVMQLDERSFGYTEGFRFEVQLLDEEGRGGAVVLFLGDEQHFNCPGASVPEAVFRAALSRSVGNGEFVTSSGEFCPGYWAEPRIR